MLCILILNSENMVTFTWHFSGNFQEETKPSSILKLIWTTYLNTTSKGIDFRSFPKACLTRAPLCTSWTRHTSTHLHHQKGGKKGHNISINSIIQITYIILCHYLCKRSSGRDEDRAWRLLHAWRQIFTSSKSAELWN